MKLKRICANSAMNKEAANIQLNEMKEEFNKDIEIPQKNQTEILEMKSKTCQIKIQLMAGDVAQVVECLHSSLEALSSNPSSTKKTVESLPNRLERS
jgi:phage-related tail protein